MLNLSEDTLHLWFQSHICLTIAVGECMGGQLHLQVHICVVPFEDILHLWLQSHIYLTLYDGGSTPYPDPYPVLFISIAFALLLCKSDVFTVTRAILIALNDDLELIVLCRIRDFFKDEIYMYEVLTIIGQFHFCSEFLV